ncbi:MAG: DNA repair protein RadC [Cryomorphaceae bacterium]|nr:DNA repair protein RadC [Cryomorphaceae bacterium]
MESTTGTIKHWAEDDRPREKLMLKGRSVLSDAELLAILIGSGTKGCSALDVAKMMLSDVDFDLNALGKFHIEDFCKFRGMGPARAVTLIAALELGRRRLKSEIPKLHKITSSKEAYNVLQPHLIDLDCEEFWVLYLSNSNHVIHKSCISKGGITGTVVDVRSIYAEAIRKGATGIIVSHNHPSGNLKPSNQDLNLTKKIRDAGFILDIKLLDHLIIANSGYLSFADDGRL